MISIFMLVRIIDTEKRSCKCRYLSESYKQRVVYLPLGGDSITPKEKRHAAERKDCRGNQLYIDIRFHSIFCRGPRRRLALVPPVGRGGIETITRTTE